MLFRSFLEELMFIRYEWADFFFTEYAKSVKGSGTSDI